MKKITTTTRDVLPRAGHWWWVLRCGMFGVIMAGCGASFRGVPAEFWFEDTLLQYTSYPGLIARPWPLEDQEQRARQLIDSLGLEDVSDDVLGHGGMYVLRRKDQRAFDRMNSPELQALRAGHLIYGPIAFCGGGYVTDVFETMLVVQFKEISQERADSIVRSWKPESYSSQASSGNPLGYIVLFPDAVGEGIVDIAARVHADANVWSVRIGLWHTDTPLE